MKADRCRNVFIILTIALAVCLMGVICFIYSAQQMQTLDNILGQYQAGCSGLTKEEVVRLADAGRFEKWGYTADAGSVRHEDSVLNVSFVSEEMIDLMDYGEIIGNYPKAENELCVDRSFFYYFDLPAEVGQTLTLNLGSGEKAYTVTGILESENNSRIFTVWISEESVDTDSHKAPYDLQFRFEGSQGIEPERLRMEIEAFFREMGIPEDRTFYSSNYFGMLDLYLGNGMDIYVLSVFVAVICAIAVYNIFYIFVMGKMREYGRLKVLGATPEQLKRVVKRERRLLTVAAIPPGLILAAGIALAAVPGYWFWRDNLKSAVVISFLTYGIVLIAARKPLSMVGKVSAIEAIRATAYSGQQGRAVSSLEDKIAVLESGMQGELKRDYCLLIFIFVFSLMNLANTLITSLLARQQEFGVFQSVGMSGRQMAEMLSCECLYYIGITLLVTLTAGTVCSLAVCHIFDQAGMFGKLTYHFPVFQVLVFAAALLLVQTVFSVCAVRYSRRFSLVERIKATD